MAEVTEQPKAKAEAVVEYIGSADVRKVTADEWVLAGVEGQAETVWDSSNGFKVKASELSPAALKVLEANGGFKL
jgi:hypothetical protein